MKPVITFLLFTALVGCSMTTTHEKGKENIYAKFMVALGDDITDEMQCVAEFMKEPEDLKTIALKKEAKVLLDDQELKFDESYFPNYIMERKSSDFIGKHTWKVDLGNGMKKEYEFEVLPFNIISGIPEKIGASDVQVECENLKSTDKVFLMLTVDFSESSEDFLDIKPQDGFFIIPKTFLQKVDPIQLEMHFNISRVHSIFDDDYFGKGVEIEWTKITKRYTTTVIR